MLTHDVGGGFGMKAQAYPEYGAILYAARKCGRPVKWCNSRVESFLSDSAGRDGILEGELALDAKGKFLGLRMRNLVGIGAYTTQYAAIFSTMNTKNCLSSVYRIPAIGIDVKMVLTNTAPLGPYRGAGRPEAIYLIERLIDGAARRMGIDRVSLRRRNLIPPKAMPYKTPNGPIYDSGEFEAAMDKALALADWKGFDKRRAASRRNGRLRGIGMCCFLEVAGGILNEKADLRFEDGKAAIRLGVQAMGQGHLSTLAAHRGEAARHRRRRREADRRRQRRGAGRHALGRLALADDGGQRVGDRVRQRDRQGAAHRVADLRGRRPATSSSRAASTRSPAPT